MNKIVRASLYGGRVVAELNPGNHRYRIGTHVDGEITWIKASPDGVTTICNATIAKYLDDWAARCASEHIEKGWIGALEGPDGMMETSQFLALCEEAKTAHQVIRDTAGDGGSATHELIEKHLTGEPYVVPDDAKVAAGFKAFRNWLEQTDVEMVATERLVYSEKYFYCGKTDLIGRRKGKLLIGDFKTGSGVYDDQPYQLAGYAAAVEEETGDKIEDGLIIHLDKKTGRFKEYPFTLDDDMKGFWKSCVIHYKGLKIVRRMLKDLKDGKRAA